MGRKRPCEVDDFELSGTTKKRRSCSEEYDSDESLHLPETIFGGKDTSSSRKKSKKKHQIRHNENGHNEPPTEFHSMSENEGKHCDAKECSSECTQNGQFELYLIRKPVEISTEELSNNRFRIRSCFSKEKKVIIGDKSFIAHGSIPTTQMFHIPAEIMHSSENPWFTGIGSPITGFVVLSRTELCGSADLLEGSDSTLNSACDLPFKRIKRKVPRKGIHNFKQRLHANAVQQFHVFRIMAKPTCVFSKSTNNSINDARDVHSIPCKVDYNGAAPVSGYFIQQIKEDGSRHAAFRGHGLAGVTLNMPSGYELYVLKKRGGDIYDIESKKDSFVLWEWDREAGERSYIARALSQLEIAHKLAED